MSEPHDREALAAELAADAARLRGAGIDGVMLLGILDELPPERRARALVGLGLQWKPDAALDAVRDAAMASIQVDLLRAIDRMNKATTFLTWVAIGVTGTGVLLALVQVLVALRHP